MQCCYAWLTGQSLHPVAQGGHPGMMNGMYGMPHANGLVPQQAQRAQQQLEEPPAKRYKPAQAQAVMQGNHGTSLVEAMNALEIQSHLETLLVR